MVPKLFNLVKSNSNPFEMGTAITEGIQIDVKSSFVEEYSHIENDTYFFRYTIEIENLSDQTVQLLRRDWYIFDSLNLPKIISGAGVVGQQPILNPGDSFSYSSACSLDSTIGYMTGNYTFKNVNTGEEFPVLIPQFDLYFPGVLN